MEYPDEAWVDEIDLRQRRAYERELRLHPHPNDPDHPDPEDYGIFDHEEDDEDS